MNDVQQYVGGRAVAARQVRKLDRGLANHQISRELRQSQADAETDLAIGKMQNVTIATGIGMQAVVTVAQAQQALEQLAPAASGRLALIADMHAIQMSDCLQDLRCQLRRI